MDQSGCAGSQINFSASSSGTTFAWTFGNGNNSALLSPSTFYMNPGTYSATLTATNSQGCSATDNVTVTINPSPLLTSTDTDVACFGVCNGTASVTASGGAVPYSFVWSNGTNTQTITGLCSGYYDVTVTDANGCINYDTLFVDEPTALVANTSSTNVTCSGACNGTATVSVSGGTPSYTYSWMPGNLISPSIASLCVGTYTLYATDANGCTTSSTVVITAPAPFTVMASSPQTICAGDTATLNGAASGGIPPYSYSWNDGSSNFTGLTIMAAPVTSTNYTLTATDNTGCTAVANTSVIVMPLSDIYGHVSYSGGSLNTGTNTAVAFQYSAFLSTFDTIQLTTVDVNGDFHFTALQPDTYLVKVFNDTTVHPLLIPTYYGNEYMWDSALVINHFCGTNDTTNIQMLEVPMMSGPGVITGTITEGLGFSRVPGEPIPGIDIKLGRNPGGQLIASTQSESSPNEGQYRFVNVPLNNAGETYTIYVDIPGLGRISTYNFVIDAGNTQYQGMDYEADSTSVYITQLSVGIKPVTVNNNSLNVYPNPAKDNVEIEYIIDSYSNVELSVYTVIGEHIMQIENKEQSAGTYKYKITARGIGAGIYLVKLKTDSATVIKKIIITE
jgi:hypothetical protein